MWENWSSLYIFTAYCELIGYVPGVNLENQWYSMARYLPYTLDVETYDGKPYFNYAGQRLNMDGGNWYQYWEESDSGFDVLNWRFLFDC